MDQQPVQYYKRRTGEKGIPLTTLRRGGKVDAHPGRGTYEVNESMLADLRGVQGNTLQPGNYCRCHRPAILHTGFVVDPISVDEMEPVSRLSGLKEQHGAAWVMP